MLAYFGNSLASAVSSGSAYPLVSGVPADGCSALSYPYALPGKVVLLSRGNCTFQTKVQYQQGLKEMLCLLHSILARMHSRLHAVSLGLVHAGTTNSSTEETDMPSTEDAIQFRK